MTFEVTMCGLPKFDDPIKGAKMIETIINNVLGEIVANKRYITYMKVWSDNNGNPRYLYVAHKKDTNYNPYANYEKKVNVFG